MDEPRVLYDLIRNHAQESPEKTVIFFVNESISYGEFFDDINRATAMLLGFGIGHGNRDRLYRRNFVSQELRTAGVRELFCWEGRTCQTKIHRSLNSSLSISDRTFHWRRWYQLTRIESPKEILNRATVDTFDNQ
jgi:hypothetical protein